MDSAKIPMNLEENLSLRWNYNPSRHLDCRLWDPNQRTQQSGALLQGDGQVVWRARREQIRRQQMEGKGCAEEDMVSLQQPDREGSRRTNACLSSLPLSDLLLRLPFDWSIRKPEAKARHRAGWRRVESDSGLKGGSPAEKVKDP